MDYYKYKLTIAEEVSEIVLAFLSLLDFEVFEPSDSGWTAYVQAPLATKAFESELDDLARQFDFRFEKKLIPHQNWNTQWEKHFEPIQVEHFCGVRADFHPPFEKVQHELLITPKMAFGTGHHATTYMMIAQMEGIDFVDKKVFDFGCGTGLLAILADKLGAKQIDALDIEEPAFENCIENIKLNHVDRITPYLGGLEKISGDGYDIILANINRNVILESFPTLFNKLKKGGILLISGILAEDESLIWEKSNFHGFHGQQKTQKGDWLCLKLIKPE